MRERDVRNWLTIYGDGHWTFSRVNEPTLKNKGASFFRPWIFIYFINCRPMVCRSIWNSTIMRAGSNKREISTEVLIRDGQRGLRLWGLSSIPIHTLDGCGVAPEHAGAVAATSTIYEILTRYHLITEQKGVPAMTWESTYGFPGVFPVKGLNFLLWSNRSQKGPPVRGNVKFQSYTHLPGPPCLPGVKLSWCLCGVFVCFQFC